MSREALNYYLNTLGITGKAPLVFYDFTSYSTDGADYFVDSMESGNTTYSGQITSNVASFTGNNSGSGYFTDQHVEITNTASLASEQATFLFSHYKSGDKNGTIFSNLSGVSGYEIGINNANKLYFNHYVDGEPSIKTFDNIPSEKNIYAVKMGLGEIELRRLNPAHGTSGDYQFESTTMSIPAYGITNTPQWNIGSGEYQYEGWIDYFAYFNTRISDEKLTQLGNSLYKTYEVVGPITGATRPLLTGVQTIPTAITGEVGRTGVITGRFTGTTGYSYSVGSPVTGAVGISGTIYVPVTGILNKAYSGENYGWMHDVVYQKIENLNYILGTGGLVATGRSGFLSSGSGDFGYWVFDDNTGSYEGVPGSGNPGTLFGITGFSYTTTSIDVTGQSGVMLGNSGVTGIIYSGYSGSGLYAPSGTYTGTGTTVSVEGDLPLSYYYDYLSNQNEAGLTGFFERIMIPAGGATNKKGAFKEIALLNRLYVGTTGKRSISGTNLSLNGIAQLSGSGLQTRDAMNIPHFSSSEDYFISGYTRLIPNLSLNTQSDEPLYDYDQTGNRSGILKITNVSEYASAPFSEIGDVGQKQIFFNGVKLYSGRDYVDQGGFYPSGAVTSATGVYFAYPLYEGSTSFTGEDSDTLEVFNEYFKPNAYVLYVNGVRQSVDGFVEHAGDTDFLTGKRVVDNALTNIYNNYRTYRRY